MATMKVKNAQGQWETVGVANTIEAGSGGGELAHAVITHNTGSNTGLQYRTFDLSEYISYGTIYFLTQYGHSAPSHYACIITNGVIEHVCYETDRGSIFQNTDSLLTTPTFELTDGIMKVTGETASNLKEMADVIYVK